MTLNLNYTTDLEVKSDRTQVDRPFFNRRFKALYDELLRMDTAQMGYGATESTLVQLGLDRLNETLGPALTTLNEAAALGFLTCRVTGENHSLVTGEFVGWHVSEGADLFTPTHFLLALDETDYTNWGILSVDPDGWHATTGELSSHVVYSAKTQTSNQWQIAAHAGVLPAMEANLAASNAAKTAVLDAQATTAAQLVTLNAAIAAIQSGPVSSVAGKTGAVSLVEGDIAGLVTDLSNKASIAYVNTQTTGKQNSSVKLDALVNLTWSANKLIYAIGGNTLSTTDITDFIKTLLAAADASGAQTVLGVSTFIKTLLGAADAATARTTLGVAAAPDVPVKATLAEVTAGADDTHFVTSYGAAQTYLPKTTQINTQAGTSYTLVAADNGKIVRFTAASATTCLLSASLPIGFSCLVEQFGAGTVTLSPVTNATRRSFGSKFRTAGQYATASVFVELNSDGAHAEWNVSGNLIV